MGAVLAGRLPDSRCDGGMELTIDEGKWSGLDGRPSEADFQNKAYMLHMYRVSIILATRTCPTRWLSTRP